MGGSRRFHGASNGGFQGCFREVSKRNKAFQEEGIESGFRRLRDAFMEVSDMLVSKYFKTFQGVSEGF